MNAKVSSLLLAGVVALVLGSAPTLAQQPQLPTNSCVLYTKRMCCAHESVPAIKEMSKVPGVARVMADHKTRALIIVPKADLTPSPLAIWEAGERTKLEPFQLNTAQGIYKTKPQLR
jgi:hypothetical protein